MIFCPLYHIIQDSSGMALLTMRGGEVGSKFLNQMEVEHEITGNRIGKISKGNRAMLE